MSTAVSNPPPQETTRKVVGKKVRQFYEGCSFPGYDDYDSPQALLDKAQKGIYARLLDEQLPLGARVLDAGCGTGQLAIFLSIARRDVVGIDFSWGSLSKGNSFRKKFNMKHVDLAQMDLFQLGLREESFDYVFSNGVLHHTADPYTAFKNVLRLVKPGGYITIGLYNTYGRLFLDMRRVIFNLTRDKLAKLDYFMRQSKIGEDKRHTWYMDQYKHPHEMKMSVSEVLHWYRENGIEYINSVPKIRMGDRFTMDDKLFDKHEPGTALENLFCQLGWIFTEGKEGGFFLTMGRKPERA
ncbi:MAG TPA: class I SAM-dependent methyltransferase [Terriglobia bacterium]|jgi:ubiquinone/menaquinone biosynthesis C-methylase UbiE|nr:class I SAM-dependent methyltransferase [Terriglobia bacterium]